MRLGISDIYYSACDCATVDQNLLRCAVQTLVDIMKGLLRGLITLILGNQTVLSLKPVLRLNCRHSSVSRSRKRYSTGWRGLKWLPSVRESGIIE